MKTNSIIKIFFPLFIILVLSSCFTSSGSLLSDTVNADSGDGSGSDGDDEPAPAEPEGKLNIYSTPSGCDIYINNRYYGTAPIYLKDMPGGYYTVRAEKEGYIDFLIGKNMIVFLYFLNII